MLRLKSFLLQGLLLSALVIAVRAQLPEPQPSDVCLADDKRIAVMLVGSYHMSNPGLDQFNLKADDVLAEKRQKEIAELTNRLSKFKPTKVLVEAPYQHAGTIKRYKDYLEGTLELQRSEREQVGFRLAKLSGNKEIFPIDVRLPLDNKALGEIAKSDPEAGKKLGEMNKFGNAAIKQMGEWLEKKTIGEMLYEMNRPEFLKLAHMPYIWIFTPIAEGDNYAGADMVATWYKRNLRIFTNLTRVSEPGDRIFVIYGQGHIPIIQELVVASPDYCLVDPLPYLRETESSK